MQDHKFWQFNYNTSIYTNLFKKILVIQFVNQLTLVNKDGLH